MCAYMHACMHVHMCVCVHACMCVYVIGMTMWLVIGVVVGIVGSCDFHVCDELFVQILHTSSIS